MKGISNKILFLGLGLALTQPIATHAAEPLAQASAQAVRVIFGAHLRTKFINNILVPFGKAAKNALLRTGSAVGTGLAIEDICLSDNTGPLGTSIKQFFADNLGIIIPSNKCEANTAALAGPRTAVVASPTDTAPSEQPSLPNTPLPPTTEVQSPSGSYFNGTPPAPSSNPILPNSVDLLEEPSSPGVSVWDLLRNLQQSNTDKTFSLTDDEKKAFLQTVSDRVLKNPVGSTGGRVSITIAPVPKQADCNVVEHSQGDMEASTPPTPPTAHTPTSTNLTPTPDGPPAPQTDDFTPPPHPPTDTGWLSYIPGATVVCNNPKMSAFAYVAGGALALYTYKKLKLASYKARFYKHLTDFTVLGNQNGLNECSHMMRAFDPAQYTETTVINNRMAADFINRLEHQNMSSGFLKFIFPVHVALFSSLRYLGSIA